ncbi:hypothetical protein [Pedobacter sp. Leaf176]|uniref:hypothetical protein n=1 Tax=Pedobacter sp. Leaf176 TaxID=1736286 RepID=UPI0006FB9077|nr:hypothetical protein [Pedobacter sp. Leaf176]KQR72168.1 hypothetical protein ASF92_02380 [Pedobacter sp. Leaf176]
MKEYIYIPFNKVNKNYLEEIQAISAVQFKVDAVFGADKKSLRIDLENQNLVSVFINPVYAIVKLSTESELAKEIYNLVTLQTKKICN